MTTMTDERLAILERFGDTDTQDLCTEIRRLRSVVEKMWSTDLFGLNPGGYLVAEDPDGDPMGTMTNCIDLTPAEIAALKEVIG